MIQQVDCKHEDKYVVDKQWLYTHKARAATGLSEYHHTKGNKKGAFKILLSAAKDYGKAGNEKQRAKCLVLAVENYVHLLEGIERRSRRDMKAKVLLDMLDAVLKICDQYKNEGILDLTSQQCFILRGRIHEILGKYELAEKDYQVVYDNSQKSQDLERLSAIIQKKNAVEDFDLNDSVYSGIDLNELRDK